MANVDYMRDGNASKYLLCEKVMDYYRSRGQHHNVDVWVEKQGKDFVVRSNIVFSVKSLYKELK